MPLHAVPLGNRGTMWLRGHQGSIRPQYKPSKTSLISAFETALCCDEFCGRLWYGKLMLPLPLGAIDLCRLAHALFGRTRGVHFSWPSICTFFTFSDRLLTILHAMHLISNRVALNRTKITNFLHISYYYQRSCQELSPKFELLTFFWPGRWKSVKYLTNRSEGVQCYSCIIWGIWHFFIFHVLQNVGKVHSAS